MEAVVAVGLAGNIVQFIDFAVKVVSKGYRMYQSPDGQLSDSHDLQLITSDLVVLQTKLERSLGLGLGAGVSTEDDEAVRKLASASTQLAQQLLTRLNAVKAQGRFRRWKSLRQAVKHVCSKAEVDDMARRLSQFREELQTRLVVSLRDEVSENHKQLCRQIEILGDKTAQTLATQMSYRSSGDDLTITTQASRHAASFAQNSIGAILDDGSRNQDKESALKQAILKAFEYDNMNHRYDTIPEAHAKTFRWILEDEGGEDILWDNFLQWAWSDNALYWVCGKAASGKSTLMKFLLSQEVVDRVLNKWAGTKRLIKADFFFSALGSPIQRSQSGLLRSLLRKVLAACEIGLLKTMLQDIWNQLLPLSCNDLSKLRSGWKIWRISELASLLETVLLTVGKTSNVCLFVDGLDEFEGDHAELAVAFSRFAKIPNIKLCLSSRPLAAIEYEFAGCSSLQLQDLTHGCIQQYIRDKLTAHRHFEMMKQDDSLRAVNLIDRVAVLSSGVFLWVHLVVKSLLEGLTNHDDISDLERRLMDLPPELDALYKMMLQSINPPFYRSQASKLLQVVYLMKGTISGLALSLIDDPEPFPPATGCLEPLPLEFVDTRVKRMADRLKTRCKGLVEVRSLGHSHPRPTVVYHPLRPDQVRYLHLTVKEFLENPEHWNTVVGWAGNLDFDANIACSQGLLALARRTFKYHGWGKKIANTIDSALSFAKQAEDSTGKPHRAFLEHLDEVTTEMFPRRSIHHWSSDFISAHDMGCRHECLCPSSNFAMHAVFKGLALYVETIPGASLHALNSESTEFLLDLATGCGRKLEYSWEIRKGRHFSGLGLLLPDLASDNKTDYREARDLRPHSAMIKLLLDRGLSPNESRCDRTPWRELLMHMREIQASEPSRLLKFIDTTKLFLLYGADLTCTLPSTNDPAREETAVQVLTSIFQDLPRSVTQDLFRIMSETLACQIMGQQQNAKLLASTNSSSKALEERITAPSEEKKRKRKQTSNSSAKRRRKR